MVRLLTGGHFFDILLQCLKKTELIRSGMLNKIYLKNIAYGLIFTLIFNFGTLSYAFASVSTSSLVSAANSSRTQSGLGTLSINSALVSAATAKANDMINNDYFSHNSPDGRQPWDFIFAAGYNYVYAGENLAIGYESPSEIHTAWMNSSSHRDNILNPNFREIGIAAVTGEYQGAEITVVVQMFGSKTEETPVINEEEINQENNGSTQVNSKEFAINMEKTNFSPNKIFAGGEVAINIAINGEASDLFVMMGDQKVAFQTSVLENNLKIYSSKITVTKAGDYLIILTVRDKWGNKESKELGKLTVSEKVVAKASTYKNNNFFTNNLAYFILALMILSLVFGGYLVIRYKKHHKFA